MLFEPFEQDKSQLAECRKCQLFVGSTEVPYTAHYPCFTSLFSLSLVHYPVDAVFGVTIIATAT